MTPNCVVELNLTLFTKQAVYQTTLSKKNFRNIEEKH